MGLYVSVYGIKNNKDKQNQLPFNTKYFLCLSSYDFLSTRTYL